MLPLRRASAVGLLLAAVVGGTPGATAAEWYLESEVRLQSTFDDNYELSTTDEQLVFGGTLVPQIKLGRRTDALDIALTAQAELNGFVVGSDQSNIKERIQFQSRYLTERSVFDLGMNFAHESVTDNPEDNTGRFTERTDVLTFGVTPSWSYRLSPVDQLTFATGFVDRRYDTDDRVDYRNFNASAGWRRAIDPLLGVTASVSASRYQPEGDENTDEDARPNTVVAGQVGLTYDIEDRLQLTASAGPQFTFTESDGESGADVSYVLNIGAVYEVSELTSLRTNVSHQAEPSASGGTSNRERVSIALDHRWSEFVTLRLAAGYIGNEFGDDVDDDFRRSFNVQPSVTWKLDRDLDLSASYRFRYQTFDDTDDVARSNAVFLSLTYRLPRLSWSE